MSIPTFQRAIVQDSAGKPSITDIVPVPKLRPGKVLVKTVAVALNPSDHKMGKAFPSPGAMIGMDFSGHVVAIGDDVAARRPDIKIGMAVCGVVHGSNPADHEIGTFAEYVLAQPETLLRVPDNWSMAQAATLGLALLTNIIALWSSLGLTIDTPSDSAVPVLIYGGSTACGTMAIQLLRTYGFDPIATCSPRNFSLVKAYGASEAFDYSLPDIGQEIRARTRGRLRHALDCIADEQSTACCYAALGRPGGRYVCLEAAPSEWRTREAVQAEFVLAFDGLGEAVELGGEYTRGASAERHKMAEISFRSFPDLICQENAIRAHPTEVVGHGFESILKGLDMLQSGNVSGKKLAVVLQENHAGA